MRGRNAALLQTKTLNALLHLLVIHIFPIILGEYLLALTRMRRRLLAISRGVVRLIRGVLLSGGSGSLSLARVIAASEEELHETAEDGESHQEEQQQEKEEHYK